MNSAQEGSDIVRGARFIARAQGDFIGGEPVGRELAFVAEDDAHGIRGGGCREDAPYMLVLDERRVNVVEQQVRDVGLLLHHLFMVVRH
ncbi:hypothetical protein [Streptomyces albofaciens]|uniref:hypothetical protein n=1 Tax=Streptomyces albofaciens TaxID=66866 RepID=UPI001AD738E6|nr:hypothetical protein [Streptomyces albofaciens]